MSNIYVTEPSTNGKVVLKTTVGEIEIELWSKETPKACRNFVQLCMEGYYNDTIFHRLIPDFIVQGGDPTGTGEGGENIYGEPFKTESHSRLSFNRRGLVGMASLDENLNGSQFFFTLGPAKELDGKHTLFGRVVGDTLFNMLRLGESEVGRNERPTRIHQIVSTNVLLNPYDDIVLRQVFKKKSKVEEEVVKVTAKATKNFSLLSFGEEAEEEEQVTNIVTEQFRNRGKSAHDLLNDARLSAEPVSLDGPESELLAKTNVELVQKAEELRRKREEDRLNDPNSDESKAKRLETLREESEELRRQIKKSKKLELERELRAQTEQERVISKLNDEKMAEEAALALWEARKQAGDVQDNKNVVVEDLNTFSDDLLNYKMKAKQLRKAEAQRESSTLQLLERFSSRLHSVVNSKQNKTEELNKFGEMDDWMTNPLVSEEPTPAKQVLDPSIAHPDRYDLYDPRNPLNVRKRGGDVLSGKGKKNRYE